MRGLRVVSAVAELEVERAGSRRWLNYTAGNKSRISFLGVPRLVTASIKPSTLLER